MKPRAQHKRQHSARVKKPNTHQNTPPKKQPEPLFVLDMLDGNYWRHLVLTYRDAKRLIQRTHHRGYTLEPYDNR
ncbi:hypothetical protein OPW19_11245 [Vibrio europaeus]|uniref:hypothetical protein n=1 Tax=Vibrio europaeus TaxID=300876 RepID=UPI00233EC001|nr:hypothetical protein [Vibrio europaeus]MDC5820395.1 hypothetical protein [Vibrio europaeus]